MNNVTIAIQAGAPIGTISHRLYGHFAEHLDCCCYDGLWWAPNARIHRFGQADRAARAFDRGVRADHKKLLSRYEIST